MTERAHETSLQALRDALTPAMRKQLGEIERLVIARNNIDGMEGDADVDNALAALNEAIEARGDTIGAEIVAELVVNRP